MPPKHHHFYHDVEVKFVDLITYSISLFVAAVVVLINLHRQIGFCLLLLCDTLNLFFILEHAVLLIVKRREYYNVLKRYYYMLIARLIFVFLFWILSIWLTVDVGLSL